MKLTLQQYSRPWAYYAKHHHQASATHKHTNIILYSRIVNGNAICIYVQYSKFECSERRAHDTHTAICTMYIVGASKRTIYVRFWCEYWTHPLLFHGFQTVWMLAKLRHPKPFCSKKMKHQSTAINERRAAKECYKRGTVSVHEMENDGRKWLK